MKTRTPLLFLSLLTLAPIQLAIAGPSTFTSIPIFNQDPLEAKLGTFTNGLDPDALAVVLWSSGINSNNLDAITIPPPYDGTGITSESLVTNAPLFSLGDICNVGNNVVVPFINGSDIQVARFNGTSWAISTVPGTTINNFDSADCATTDNGIFISGHDRTDNENEIFRSTNGGASYTFYSRYPSVAGPFGGGVREGLASDSTRYLMSLHQTTGGQVRVAEIDTDKVTPTPGFTNIIAMPPPGGFTFVKESAARAGSNGTFYFTYNADANARTIEIDQANPGAFTQRNLGAVSNANPFGFQGGTLVHIEDEDGNPVENNVLWGDYFIFDPTSMSPAVTNPFYPAAGVGGPVDGCRVDGSGDFLKAFFLVPRGAPEIGTDLLINEMETFDLFDDGFESGDLTSWRQCD